VDILKFHLLRFRPIESNINFHELVVFCHEIKDIFCVRRYLKWCDFIIFVDEFMVLVFLEFL
jgi:hypothetical protein